MFMLSKFTIILIQINRSTNWVLPLAGNMEDTVTLFFFEADSLSESEQILLLVF